MKGYFQKIRKFIGSRLGLNLLFWSIFTGEWCLNQRIPHDYPAQWYLLLRFIIFSLVIVLVYTNNLLLIPRLLARRKYWFYFIAIFIYSYFIAILFTLTIQCMLYYFPSMHAGDISFIVTEVPKGFGIHAIIEGATNHFFFLLMFAAFFSTAWYVSNFTRQQKVLEEVQKKQIETELSFLKNQINPHFLFNTLNNLYGLALKKSESAPDAILKLSYILRYLLYESNVSLISFEREKEIMESYIGLELLRLSGNNKLTFNISSDSNGMVPPLLWLPVLENVFKHGTRMISDSYFIDYSYTIAHNSLTIYSRNTYKPKGENGKSTGIGLENLRKRLSLLYPGQHFIHTSKDDSMYTTEIKIALS